ncbi:MAG: disulfide bond formation protein B [Gammaproteobacteria bacterium]|nr:MAG: disulfide bond formation protein B [Gammaproteobacteria bacterium]
MSDFARLFDTSGNPAARRLTWLFCFISVVGLMSYGLYAQYVLYYDPCPLCLTQRAFYVGVGIFAMFGIFTYTRVGMQRVLAVLSALSAIGGIVTAGRQIWLQHLPPDKVPECGPGLAYWIENKPLFETVKLLFQGDGNCAEIDWVFLGFSMAVWSLAWFLLLLAASLYVLVRTRGASHGSEALA